MTQNYMQPWTPWNDLKQAAEKVYKGKTYEDQKTGNLYSFQGFLECAVEGQIHVKNLTTGAFELLPYAKWFSLEAIKLPKNKKRFNREGLTRILTGVKNSIKKEVSAREESTHNTRESSGFKLNNRI